MNSLSHTDNCQSVRVSAFLDSCDSGEEHSELDAALKRWAKKENLTPDSNGNYDHCTCHTKDTYNT